MGLAYAGSHVVMLVQNLGIRIIQAATCELLRELTLDPSRNYQPTGRPPGPTRHPAPASQTEESGTLTWVRGVLDVSRHHTGVVSDGV
jgi:hypothetical protein